MDDELEGFKSFPVGVLGLKSHLHVLISNQSRSSLENSFNQGCNYKNEAWKYLLQLLTAVI